MVSNYKKDLPYLETAVTILLNLTSFEKIVKIKLLSTVDYGDC